MNFLMKETAGLPNWAWGLVVVAGLGIGYFVMRSSGSGTATTTTTDTTATPTTPTPIDANAMTASGVGNGQPQIVVLPLASTSPVASTESAASSGGSASGGSGGNNSSSTNTNSGDTVSTIPPGTPRGRNVSSTILTIRNKGGSSIKSVQDYDNTNPPGVPVRAVPGGVQVRFQAYGSQVAATGAEVSGPNNVKEGTGSDSWWPVQGGYISAFDVSGVSQQNVSVVRS
jgi:hypothetical protein